jgi:predicted nucleotidyltransferase
MTVAGYQEAFDAAEQVRIESELVLRVVSLPGLAVLKVFDWGDRGSEISKDAENVATLLRQYPQAGNESRLYDDPMEIMEAVDFKLDLAGARLLGRDARHMVTRDTLKRLTRVLEDPKQRERLTIAMAGALGHTEDAMSEVERLLEQFRNGLERE